MYYVYVNEFGHRERTKECADTKAVAQMLANRLNDEADQHGVDGIWFYVRKFSSKKVAA